MKKLRIVFMGTPEFATTILKSIVEGGHDVVGVVTVPDKPAGRGQKIHESHVKEYAKEAGLNILQPVNLKDEEFIGQLRGLNADLFIVVAFRMLPEVVWSMPEKGTINLHASLLPQYRGAAPINWAIINGEQESGVTTFFIEKEIDTGKIIEQAKVKIGADENVGELYERLMVLGAQVVLDTIEKIAQGSITPIEQSEVINGELKAAPKIFKANCKIEFSKSAEDIHNFVRGLSPYPSAWCILKEKESGLEKTFKIHETKLPATQKEINHIIAEKEGILFPTSNGHIIVVELQPEGKRRMNFKEFLAGNDISHFELSE